MPRPRSPVESRLVCSIVARAQNLSTNMNIQRNGTISAITHSLLAHIVTRPAYAAFRRSAPSCSAAPTNPSRSDDATPISRPSVIRSWRVPTSTSSTSINW